MIEPKKADADTGTMQPKNKLSNLMPQNNKTDTSDRVLVISPEMMDKMEEVESKFNPLDIARKLTFGTSTRAEMFGKISGKRHDLLYFFTKPSDKKFGADDQEKYSAIPPKFDTRSNYRGTYDRRSDYSSGIQQSSSITMTTVRVLTEMLDFMKTTREDDLKQYMIKDTLREQQEQLVETRHKEVISAILAISKNKTKADKHIKKEVEKTTKETQKEAELPKEKPVVKPEVAKPAAEKPVAKPEVAKPAAEKPVAKPEVPPRVEPKETAPSVTPKEVPPVEKAPKPRIKLKSKPTAEPVPPAAPTTTPVSGPPVSSVPKAAPVSKAPSGISTAAKVATITGAAAGTGLVPLLAQAESGNYNQLVFPIGGKKSGYPSTAPLTKMTIQEVLDYQEKNMADRRVYPSNAVGKYQIIKSTLEEAIKILKIDKSKPFDKTMQDYIFKEYLIKKKRQDIEDYISGKSNNLVAAQLALAQEFASFGVPERVYRKEARKKPKKGQQQGDLIWDARWIEKGQSYYIGAAGNQASVSPEQSAKALSEEREARLKNNPIPPATNIPSTGEALSKKSTESADQRKDLQQSPSIIGLNQTNNNVNINDVKKNIVQPKKEGKPMFEGKE